MSTSSASITRMRFFVIFVNLSKRLLGQYLKISHTTSLYSTEEFIIPEHYSVMVTISASYLKYLRFEFLYKDHLPCMRSFVVYSVPLA